MLSLHQLTNYFRSVKMKFLIVIFAIIVAALASADPEPDMEWTAEYGRIGLEYPLRFGAYPYYRIKVPREYRITYPYALKTEYDPEFFYNTFGYYPDH